MAVKAKAKASERGDIGAQVMLVALSLIWGITWPLMKIALLEIPMLSMRTFSTALGALTLYLYCRFQGRDLHIPTFKAWVHVIVASLLNIVGFVLLTSLAQLAASTSRVTILAYTMPVWSVLLAWPILGERPNRLQVISLALCVAGLAVLIYPLAKLGVAGGIVIALSGAFSWAAGTVYLKWAKIAADPMGVASWQLTVAFVVIVVFMLVFEGAPDFSRARPDGLAAMAFTGIFGNAVAYGLWFAIVERLPAATASLGILSVPVIGVVATIAILGEVPTGTDIAGFALIFAASVCVLLARHSIKQSTA